MRLAVQECEVAPLHNLFFLQQGEQVLAVIAALLLSVCIVQALVTDLRRVLDKHAAWLRAKI